VKNLPRIKKTKPNGRSVIAPTIIHERDSELVGAVLDRPQTVQEPKGRREESPAYQKNETQRAIGDRPCEFPRT